MSPKMALYGSAGMSALTAAFGGKTDLRRAVANRRECKKQIQCGGQHPPDPPPPPSAGLSRSDANEKNRSKAADSTPPTRLRFAQAGHLPFQGMDNRHPAARS